MGRKVKRPKLKLGSRLRHPCPSCGSNMVLRKSKHGLFYGCQRYPMCEETHGAHQATGEPLGIPTTWRTRKARVMVHTVFDKLWNPTDGRAKIRMSRTDSYRCLRVMLNNLNKKQIERDRKYIPAHIGSFNEETCYKVLGRLEEEGFRITKKEQERIDKQFSKYEELEVKNAESA